MQARSFILPTALANQSMLARRNLASIASGARRSKSSVPVTATSKSIEPTTREMYPFPLSTMDPFRDPFFSDMDRLFNAPLKGFLFNSPLKGFWPQQQELDVSRFQVDFTEGEKGYKLTADLPGIKKEDIKMSVKDNILRIEAERKMEKDEEEGTYRRKELSYGKFRRAMQLPYDADADSVSASFTDGVLRVSLDKTEEPEEETKRIDIK